MTMNNSAVKHRARTVQDRTEITAGARRFIAGHVGDPSLCIDDVADATGVPVRTLQRALASCNTDFSREIANARFACALRLLSSDYTTYTIRAVARQCGYETPSHFTKVFRERYGVTPSLFQRATKIENRLTWRRFIDKVRPVKTGSSEYFRRRKRYNEDVQKLRGLVGNMPSAAKDALRETRRPERPVYEPRDWRADPPPPSSNALTDEQFEALFEQQLISFAERYPHLESGADELDLL